LPARSRILEPGAESKSLLVLFFRKEQNLLFLKKKKQKDFYSSRCFTIRALWPNQPLGGKRYLSIDFSLNGEVSSYLFASFWRDKRRFFFLAAATGAGGRQISPPIIAA
jgi:hypothetical protein